MPSLAQKTLLLFGESWTPEKLANKILWFDPSDPATTFQDTGFTTPALVDADVLGGYKDKSGKNYHATQGTGANQPIIKTGANGKNGRTIVRADGTASQMGLSPVQASGNYSLSYVIKRSSTGTIKYLLDTQTGRLIIGPNGSAVGSLGWNDGSWEQVAGVIDTNWHIETMIMSAPTGEIFIDGVSVGTPSYTAKAFGDACGLFANYVKSGQFLAADVGEIILCSGEWDTATRTLVESYLSSRWGIFFLVPSAYAFRAVGAGQSNPSGRGTNNQSTSGGWMLGNDYVVKSLSDPTDSNTNQVDTVSSDALAAGSFWPLLSTTVRANVGEFLYVPCALGGSSITAWLPGANHYDRSTLYGSMAYRARMSGAQVIMWWQGETDALASMSQATYNGHLDTLANAINTDLGIKLMPCKLQNSSGIPDIDEAAINAAIAEAWGDNANVLTGPDLSDLASDDDYHLKTDAKLLEAASRWYTALAAAFGW